MVDFSNFFKLKKTVIVFISIIKKLGISIKIKGNGLFMNHIAHQIFHSLGLQRNFNSEGQPGAKRLAKRALHVVSAWTVCVHTKVPAFPSCTLMYLQGAAILNKL